MTSSRNRSLRAGATALAATAAVGLAACGGSGSSGAKPLDRADLTKQLNTICADAAKGVQGIKQPTSLAGLSGYFDQVAPQAHTLLDRLTKLKAAPDAQADFTTLVQAEKSAVAAFDKARSGTKGSTPDTSAIAQVAAQAPKVQAAARKLGVSCS